MNLPAVLVDAARRQAGPRGFTDYCARALRTQLLADDLRKLAEHQTPEDAVADALEALEETERRGRPGRAA